MKRAADKLAAFVAARGRAAEDGARAKNPGGDTPFRFLHDATCNDYRYYESKIAEAEEGAATGGVGRGRVHRPDATATRVFPRPNPRRATAPTTARHPHESTPFRTIDARRSPAPPARRRKSRWDTTPGETTATPVPRPRTGEQVGRAKVRLGRHSCAAESGSGSIDGPESGCDP